MCRFPIYPLPLRTQSFSHDLGPLLIAFSTYKEQRLTEPAILGKKGAALEFGLGSAEFESQCSCALPGSFHSPAALLVASTCQLCCKDKRQKGWANSVSEDPNALIQRPSFTSNSHYYFIGWIKEKLRHWKQNPKKQLCDNSRHESIVFQALKCLCDLSSFFPEGSWVSADRRGEPWKMLGSSQSNSIRGRNGLAETPGREIICSIPTAGPKWHHSPKSKEMS